MGDFAHGGDGLGRNEKVGIRYGDPYATRRLELLDDFAAHRKRHLAVPRRATGPKRLAGRERRAGANRVRLDCHSRLPQ